MVFASNGQLVPSFEAGLVVWFREIGSCATSGGRNRAYMLGGGYQSALVLALNHLNRPEIGDFSLSGNAGRL